MKQLALAFALTLAACGPAVDHAPTVGNQPGPDPSAGPAAATACPSDEALSEVARAAWQKRGGNVSVSCVAVRVGGETLWYLDGSFEPEPNDEWTVGLWSSLVTPAGEVRWTSGDDELPLSAIEKSYTIDFQAVDLDGDGSDEIVHVAGYAWGGYDDSAVVVLRLSATGIEAISGDGLLLSSDNSAADPDPAELHSCEGALRIVDAGGGKKHLEITYGGGCERTGAVAWAYDGKALVEVK